MASTSYHRRQAESITTPLSVAGVISTPATQPIILAPDWIKGFGLTSRPATRPWRQSQVSSNSLFSRNPKGSH